MIILIKLYKVFYLLEDVLYVQMWCCIFFYLNIILKKIIIFNYSDILLYLIIVIKVCIMYTPIYYEDILIAKIKILI